MRHSGNEPWSEHEDTGRNFAELEDNQEDAQQEDPEQEDPEEPEQTGPERSDQDVVTSPSDLAQLSDRDDWPKWFVDAIDHLQIISNAKMWVALVANFIKLERSLGFPRMVRKSLTMCEI